MLPLLRLRRIFNGTFVKLGQAPVGRRRMEESYIAGGYPNLESGNELISKRGYGKINKELPRPVTHGSLDLLVKVASSARKT